MIFSFLLCAYLSLSWKWNWKHNLEPPWGDRTRWGSKESNSWLCAFVGELNVKEKLAKYQNFMFTLVLNVRHRMQPKICGLGVRDKIYLTQSTARLYFQRWQPSTLSRTQATKSFFAPMAARKAFDFVCWRGSRKEIP